MTDKVTLKSWFQRGKKPTSAQFAAWMDSYWHKAESLAINNISGLAQALAAKLNSSDLASAMVGKQNVTDPTLETSSHTVVGAINELNSRTFTRSYTLDFGTASELMQDVNVQGDSTIDRIITRNVAALYISYTGVVRQLVDLTTPTVSIEIPADEVITWEIVRNTDVELACVGVRYEIN